MAKQYREYKLRIHGKIDGKDITPLTLPMTRLVEYLKDFATLLGSRDHVHFLKVGEGSAAPTVMVDMEEDTRVRERLKNAAAGIGNTDANTAYAQLNTRLTEDEGFGEILERIGERDAKVIEFPGKRRELSQKYGPIKQSTSVQGELRRVGGQEPTIPVHLIDADGNPYYCWAKKHLVLELAPYVFQQVRVTGIATWERDENAKWNMLEFEIQSFIAPLAPDDASTVISKLRGVPDSDWNKFEDPLEELRRIRHGEDEIQ
jgi:hypothetical protein